MTLREYSTALVQEIYRQDQEGNGAVVDAVLRHGPESDQAVGGFDIVLIQEVRRTATLGVAIVYLPKTGK